MAFLQIQGRQQDFAAFLGGGGEPILEDGYREVIVRDPDDSTREHKLGVMSIDGPMFRHDHFCGSTGSITRAQQVRSFGQSSTPAMVVRTTTPGGQVSGGEEFADAVAEVSEKKPIIFWGESMCSLGYYVASGSSHIMLSGKNAMIGSVGVLYNYLDFTGMLEDMKLRDVYVAATTSPDKLKHHLQNPTKKELKAFAKERLDPLHANFKTHVLNHRDVQESALKGNVYYTDPALDLNLADSIGSFHDATLLALDMAGVTNRTQSKPNTSKTMESTSPEAVATTTPAAAQPEATATPATPATSAVEAAAVEPAAETPAPAATEKPAWATALEARVASLEAENKDLKAENAELQAMPAADPEATLAAPAEDAANATDGTPGGLSYSEKIRQDKMKAQA